MRRAKRETEARDIAMKLAMRTLQRFNITAPQSLCASHVHHKIMSQQVHILNVQSFWRAASSLRETTGMMPSSGSITRAWRFGNEASRAYRCV